MQGFDALNRLELVTPLVPTGNPHGLVETGPQYFGYDGLSRMVLAIESNGGATETARVFYIYDSLAHVLEEHQFLGDIGGVYTESIVTAQYDGVGNLLDLLSPRGTEVIRTYDALERLDTVSLDGTVAQYSYAGPSRVRSRFNAMGNYSLEIGYDSLKRPTSWSHVDLDTTDAVVDVRYGYDAVGNRLWERRLHDDEKGKRYSYDSAYRLLETLEGTITSSGDLDGPATTSETAAYDGVGNRISVDRDGVVQSYDTNELNQYHEINGVTLTYDANGNLQSSAEGTFAYDAFNRLRSATGANGSISYLYDARGRRVRAGAIDFAYFESRAIEEWHNDSGKTSTVVFGIGVDEMLAQRRSDVGDIWSLEDALGSVVAVADGTGVVERYRYESFGKPTFCLADGTETVATESAVGNRFLFTGREFEAETGLYLSPST